MKALLFYNVTEIKQSFRRKGRCDSNEENMEDQAYVMLYFYFIMQWIYAGWVSCE